MAGRLQTLLESARAVRLQAIPPRIRSVVYSLPLFIGWIVPLTWEKAPAPLAAGRRSLALFLLYGASIGATYLLSGLIQLFVSNPGFVVALLFFLIRMFCGLAYVAISLYLAWLAYKSETGDGTIPDGKIQDLLHRGANRFEALVSR